jgi:hypothetical protein
MKHSKLREIVFIDLVAMFGYMFQLTPSSGQDKVRFHYLLTLCEFKIIISLMESHCVTLKI